MMECTTGLTDDEFDGLLAWLREEGVEGYPPILGLSGSLRATLMYLRQNIVQVVIGEILGVSQPTVSRAIKALTEAISRTLAVLLLTAEEHRAHRRMGAQPLGDEGRVGDDRDARALDRDLLGEEGAARAGLDHDGLAVVHGRGRGGGDTGLLRVVVGETPCGVVGRDEHRDTALAPDEATSLEVVEVLTDGDGGDVGDTGELGDGDAASADDGLEKGELTSTHGVHAPFLAHEA